MYNETVNQWNRFLCLIGLCVDSFHFDSDFLRDTGVGFEGHYAFSPNWRRNLEAHFERRFSFSDWRFRALSDIGRALESLHQSYYGHLSFRVDFDSELETHCERQAMTLRLTHACGFFGSSCTVDDVEAVIDRICNLIHCDLMADEVSGLFSVDSNSTLSGFSGSLVAGSHPA